MWYHVWRLKQDQPGGGQREDYRIEVTEEGAITAVRWLCFSILWTLHFFPKNQDDWPPSTRVPRSPCSTLPALRIHVGEWSKGHWLRWPSEERAKIFSYLDCQSSGGKHWSLLWLVKVSAIILGHILLEAQAGAKVGDFKWQWQWFVLFFQGWTVQPLDDLESSGPCFSRRCVPWPIGGGDICQFWFFCPARSPKRLPWWTWWPAVLWTLATTKGRVGQSPQQRWRWGLELSWSSGWRFPRAQRCKIGQKLLMTHNVTSILCPLMTHNVTMWHTDQVLVLGAWGCGVFGWPPGTVARYILWHIFMRI